MKTSKEKINDLLQPIELEQLRKEQEYQDKIDEDLLPINEKVITFRDHITKYVTRHTPIRVVHKFKSNLDKTSQEDAERSSMANIFQKVLNGEPTPLGAIKENSQYSEALHYSDSDLTDMHLINQHYKEKYGDNYQQSMMNTLKENDELNDEHQKKIRSENNIADLSEKSIQKPIENPKENE